MDPAVACLLMSNSIFSLSITSVSTLLARAVVDIPQLALSQLLTELLHVVQILDFSFHRRHWVLLRVVTRVVILEPDELLCPQIGNLLKELVWWRSCSSCTKLFAYSSSFRTSEVGLPLPYNACMCSRLFVWSSVIWIVRSSGSHAVAAPVSATRVRDLVRGLLRWIWTKWNTLSFPPELARVIHQAHHIV